ncbi:fibrocystin-L isoform X1, partial [Paramuricea clavata]
MLRIYGKGRTGFSGDQFAFDDPTLGNVVTLTGRDGVTMPCAVVQTDTSTTKISCELGRPPAGHERDTYSLSITVNGEPLGGGHRHTYCYGTCRFYFQRWRTPSITNIDIQAGLPVSGYIGDQVIKITGKLYTSQFGRLSDNSGDSFDDSTDATEITRAYLGGYNCDTNDENGQVYGITYVPYSGHFLCRGEITAPGSYGVSYLVSNYGRSQINNDDLSLVDANDVIYQYQAHSDVTSVEPRSGSRAGGTILTIKGKAFSFIKENVKVNVGGVPCEVLTSNRDTITCKTGALREENEGREFYPGGRGFICDTWPIEEWIPNVRDFNANATYVHSHVHQMYTDFATCVNDPSFVKPTYRLVGRLTAYFVPPSSGIYRFGSTSDDSSVVYLSNTSSPLDKREIASNLYYTGPYNWNKYDTQWSERMYLEEGRAYYIEGDYYDTGGAYFLNLGMHKETTSLTKDDVPMAVQEQQYLKIYSNIEEETQTITYENWKDGFVQQEEQLVTVKQCSLVNNVCQQPPPFTLNYNGDITGSLVLSISAADLQTALNGRPSISNAGSVTVTLESSDSQENVYRVKFNFAEPETTSMLQDGSQLRGQFVSVAVDKAGINSNKGFRLSLGGKRTQVIPSNVTEAGLESTFTQLFTTQCTFSANTDDAYFYQGYEGDSEGYERGDRVNDQTPHCGRQVLTNPNALYAAGLTVIKPGNIKGGEFNLQQYSRVCYAFRGGNDTVSLRIYVKYTDKQGTQTHTNLYHAETAIPQRWQYVCVNLNELATADTNLWGNRQTGSIMYVKDIYISGHVMVDDVWIGSTTVT